MNFKKIDGLPSEWQHFSFAVLLHLMLPLLPLGLERWFAGHVEAKSAVLTAAMYSLAIGLSSRNVLIFGLSILSGVAFSAAFGYLSKTATLENADILSYCAIALILVFHTLERYNRHVVDKRPFLEFILPIQGAASEG